MAIQAGDLNCQKCGEGEKMLRGCEQEVEPYFWGDEFITRCPLRLITFKTRKYIGVYNSIKNTGCLINSGGLSNQSPKMIDVIRVIEREIAKQQCESIRSGRK